MKSMLLSALLLALLAMPAAAQVPADTVPAAAAAAAAGRAAARRVNAAGYFLVGAAGGLPIGFFGIQGWGQDGDGVPRAISGAGAVVIAGTLVRAGRDPSLAPEVAEQLAQRDSAYRAAFMRAYTIRLQDRRKAYTLLGGILGMVAGFLGLVSMLPYS